MNDPGIRIVSSMSLISVIIPNYNGQKWLAKTIDSCLMQKEFIREIIVIDDFSTDNSLLFLKEYTAAYQELVKVFSNKEKGGNNARNYGYSQSSGEYIQWLDADDQVLGNKFRDQLKVFEADRSIDIVYSDWRLHTYDPEGVLIKEEFKKCKPVEDFLYELIIDNWSAPNNYLVRRNVAEQLFHLQAWNPATKVGQDREYFSMAALIGAKFVYAPGFYSVYNRWNINSVSADVDAAKLESLDKMFGRFENYLSGQNNINSDRLIKYHNALNTQRALLNVYGFPSRINRGKLTLRNAEWKLIHGLRTKIKFFLMVLFNRYRDASL